MPSSTFPKVCISSHVIFNEHIFPFKQPIPPLQHTKDVTSSHTLIVLPLSSLHVSSPSDITPSTPLLSHPSIFSSIHPMITRHKIRSLKPKAFPNHHVYNTTLGSAESKPSCYTHAIKTSY
jgi:hypothetical protein